jgi:biotin-dependent carboxylase-like uncharacterized protein
VIRVLVAPPFATVQDAGRMGHRDAAVSPSGAMDPRSLAVGNALVGNPPDAAALEFALGSLELRFERPTAVAVTGARTEARLGDRAAPGWTALRAETGDVLRIARPAAGAWVYVCIGGGVGVPQVLGSRSTCLAAKFGGLDGRLVHKGDALPCGAAPEGPPPGTRAPGELATARPAEPIAVMAGPGAGWLRPGEWQRLLATEFRLSAAVSRMGYRLEGPSFASDAPPDLPSAPACVGAVQLPPGGTPIVLFNDGPTVGGYPIIGVVASAHLGMLAQRRPGDMIRFKEVTVAGARALAAREYRLITAFGAAR